jgi:glycosyltransferase involved in cell wall biosynthesis
MGIYWQQVVLKRALRKDKPDVLFAPADSMPLNWGGPTLVTFHDLSYEAHPEWFGFSQRLRRRWLAKSSAVRADRVVAISEFTRRELIKHYRLPEGKIAVVYHGIDNSLREAPFTAEEELQRRIGFDGPFALMVGSIFERRYPMEVIRAFRHLQDLDIGLVIAGDDRRLKGSDLQADIGALGLAGRVAWLRYCSEEVLAGLYRAAHHLIYLSAYEGFGLPPLEGMSFGLPAIVSGRGALLEVYRESALMVEDEDEECIASAIRRLVEDETLREELSEKGRGLAENLTLQKCAEKTLKLLRELGRG